MKPEFGPVLKAVNLAMLVLYPVAWLAPLAHAGILPFFTGSELTIIGGIMDLSDSDPMLALLVALFAIAAPYLKTLLLSALHFHLLPPGRWMKLLEYAGKLSMADVFLLALYIVLVKGVGIGHVNTAWGLWLFTGLVLVSFGVAILTGRKAQATSPSL